MNKTTDRAPYWQDRPCPPWCGITHRPGDSIAESTHQEAAGVTVTASTDVPQHRATLTARVVPQVAEVILAQEHLHRDPHMVVILPGVEGQDERELRLTIAEVRQLAAGLVRLADVAEEVTR